MRAKRQRPMKQEWDVKLLIGVLTAVGAVVGYLSSGVQHYDNLATKPELGIVLEKSMKYTDDKAALTIKEAFEHSDANRQGMMIEMGKLNTDIQSALAALKIQNESLIRSVDEMRFDVSQRKQKR